MNIAPYLIIAAVAIQRLAEVIWAEANTARLKGRDCGQRATGSIPAGAAKSIRQRPGAALYKLLNDARRCDAASSIALRPLSTIDAMLKKPCVTPS